MIREPLVYVLILNWCSAKDTIECVESVQKSDYVNYKILLIDNGSPDGSEAVLRGRFTNLDFIQTGRNLGYAGGNNMGIRFAASKGADYVWVVNPDVRVDRASLRCLTEVMQFEQRIGILGPRILEKSKDQIADGAEVYPEKGYTVKHNFQARGESLLSESTLDVGYVIGCSMLLRLRMVREIGLMREDFFLYYEETELNLRAQKRGWRTAVCRTTTNEHLWSPNKRSGKFHYFKTRNAILLSRIENMKFINTLCYQLRTKEILRLISRARLRSAGYIIKRKIQPILCGIFHKIEEIPNLPKHSERNIVESLRKSLYVMRRWVDRGQKTSVEHFSDYLKGARFITPKQRLKRPYRFFKWLASMAHHQAYTSYSSGLEMASLIEVLRKKPDFVHYLYGEYDMHYAPYICKWVVYR